MSKRVLIVDDEESIRSSLERLLSFEKFKTFTAGDGRTAIDLAASERVDIVLLDIKMPGMDGLEALEELMRQHPTLPVIIISGHGTIGTAVEATKLGAFDFLEKPIDMERLLLSIRNGLARSELEQRNIQLEKRVGLKTEMIGEHPEMLAIMETVSRVAPTNARVLITGENGTGKELVARKLHELSKRSTEPFIEVNCAAIPEDLIESELFGHEKGSFTGAVCQRIGKFELADGGTLFLDEVGDMSLSAQAKVLRVLQESSFERVGGTETKRVDVRVLAASNKGLLEEAGKGRFREDLFYRLNVVPVRIPPLRERTSDIKLLAEYFLREVGSELGRSAKRLSPDALDALMDYAWPGNVRELRNVVERAVVIVNSGAEIGLRDLPPDMFHGGRGSELNRENRLEAQERDLILEALDQSGWNISRAALTLGIPRSNLRYRIEKFGLAKGG